MYNSTAVKWLFAVFIVIITAFTSCFLTTHPRLHPRTQPKKGIKRLAHLAVVLGSGGHTAEMVRILGELDCSIYAFRTYVIGEGDTLSHAKATEFEEHMQAKAKKEGDRYGSYRIAKIPRARQIHQSLFSTPISAIYTLIACLKLLGDEVEYDALYTDMMSGDKNKYYPNLIVSNGPANGAIVILAAYILRFLGIVTDHDKLITVYVESWARVYSRSLSCRLLDFAGICDRILVQWPGTDEHVGYKRSKKEFLGTLV